MSRKHCRARARRARLEASRAEFSRARDDPEALSRLLKDIAASGTPLWPIATAAATIRPLDDDEVAMISEEIAPHLVRMTPGTVRRGNAIDDEKRDWRLRP